MSHPSVQRFTVGAIVMLACAAWLVIPARSHADRARAAKPTSVEDDLQALQGKWEHKVPGDKEAGAVPQAARAVKEVKGNRETVTYYDDAGKAVRATTADFKLEVS